MGLELGRRSDQNNKLSEWIRKLPFYKTDSLKVLTQELVDTSLLFLTVASIGICRESSEH